MAKEKKEKEEKGSISGALIGLDAFTKKFNEQFGDGVGVVLGNIGTARNIQWVPFDGMALSDALGQGGLRGRIIEIFGPENSGKTTLATYWMIQCQRYFYPETQAYGRVAFIDMEHAYDPVYAQNHGLDLNRVFFVQPNSGEECFNMAVMLVESGQFDLVVLDSIATCVPQAELDGEIGDAHMAGLARIVGQSLRKINPQMKPTGTSLILINQERFAMKPAVNGMPPPMVTPGGLGPKYYSSIRLKTSKGEWIEKPVGNVIGVESKVKVVKNKVSMPFKNVTLRLMFKTGYDFEGEYIDYFKKYGLIQAQAGSWFTVPGGAKVGFPVQVEEAIPKKEGGGTRMVDERFNGTAKVTEYILSRPDLYSALKKECKALFLAKTDVTIATRASVADTPIDPNAEIPEEIEDEEDPNPEGDDFEGLPVPTAENPEVVAPAPVVVRRRPALVEQAPPPPPPGVEPSPEEVVEEQAEPEPEPQTEVAPEPVAPVVIGVDPGAPTGDFSVDADGTPICPAHIQGEDRKIWNIEHGLTPTGRKKITYEKKTNAENPVVLSAGDSAEPPTVEETLPGE